MEFSFDTETTSLDFNQAELVGFSLSYKEHQSYYCPLNHNSIDKVNLPFNESMDLLKELFENDSLTVIGQNLKYDINVLKKYSLKISCNVEDTMLMSYVLNSGGKHDLDTLSSKFLDHKPISYEDVTGKGKDQISFADVEISKAVEYACEDSDITYLYIRNYIQIFREIQNFYLSIEILKLS